MEHTGTPTWAALSAGGIRALILPDEVQHVVIAADPDPVGIMAARAAARRWLAEGRQRQHRPAAARPRLQRHGARGARMTVTPFPGAVPVTEDDLSPEYSDDALALEFSSRHAGELRYCAQWGTWLQWDGTRWKFEKTLKTFDLARSVAREFANACRNPADGPKIASASKVAAIERLARSDRRHATETDLWDADPWLLNTPGGIVDLRTGKMLPHDPDRYITKITAVAPGGMCPRWLQFLDEITGGNVELQQFLQRIAGYSLTGSTREHALFFFYGTGGNGKGVFLNTLAAILADYAAVAPMETFIASARRSAPDRPRRAARRAARHHRRKPRKAGAGPRARSRR